MTTECVELVDMSPDELQVAPPFENLFPVDARVLEAITESMREKGYDWSRGPVNVWMGRNVVVDGHTRRLAAIKAGVKSVPVCFHEFKDEDEAFDYAIASQCERRQIDDAGILRYMEMKDQRAKRGGDRGNQYTGGIPSLEGMPSTAEATAQKIKTSRAKVESARRVLDNADEYPDIKQEVLEGKKSLRMAAREIGDRKRKQKYTPIPLEETTQDDDAPAAVSSIVNHDDATREWLASHPIRAKVVADRFDEDALIYREFSAVAGEFRNELRRLIGDRSSNYQTILYHAFIRLSPLPPINSWSVCHKCGGTGGETGSCRVCRGGGYTIPGL